MAATCRVATSNSLCCDEALALSHPTAGTEVPLCGLSIAFDWDISILTQPILERLEKDPDYINTRGTYLRSGRFGEPEEIAELAFYLAATDATYMQGTDLIIDGGYTTH